MKFFQWLKMAARTSSQPSGAHRRRDPFRGTKILPMLEELENRLVPSTLMVTNTSDSGLGSLREALLDSHAGDTIMFDSGLAGSTITLNSELVIDHSLKIKGLGMNQLKIDGGGQFRVIDISHAGRVSISDLTIADGFAGPTASHPGDGGGIFDSSGVLRLKNV